MTTIYKLCFAVGLVATGGEMATNGDEHAETIKRLAAPFLEEDRPSGEIREIPVSELDQLPSGVQWVRD